MKCSASHLSLLVRQAEFGRIALGVGLIAAVVLCSLALACLEALRLAFLAHYAGTIGTLTTVGTALSAIGAGLVLGGVAQMISPTPKPQQLSEAEGFSHFLSAGLSTRLRQGTPVPVILGRALLAVWSFLRFRRCVMPEIRGAGGGGCFTGDTLVCTP